MIYNQSRLFWACRRGMLELDILLNGFLTDCFDGLNLEQKNNFVSLLSYQDPDIFAWVMGHATPEEAGLITITTAIRSHAQSQF